MPAGLSFPRGSATGHHPTSRRDRADHAVERFELAKRVEYFGAIDCQRVAHGPSEADVDTAGFFRERIPDPVEKVRAGRARGRRYTEVPVVVLLDRSEERR